MKRFGNLWDEVVSFENLYRAYRTARLGKTDRIDVQRFDAHLEPALFELQAQLQSGEYTGGGYRQFTLYERKPRLISAAPFADRVVHHAVMRVLEPLIDPRFIHDSYACREGKGVHRAVDRYQIWARENEYALKIDISAYFASIDHALLNAALARHIKDQRVLALLATIIAGSPPDDSKPPRYFEGDDLLSVAERRRGLPIGNLTSQFFANLYLNQFDHFVKEQLGVRCYLRYVDDMVLLGNSKAELWQCLAAMRAELEKLRLTLHPRKIHLCHTREGLDVLGYRVFRGHRHLRDDNAVRFARKLRGMAKAYGAGRYELSDFKPSICAWLGHAKHADCEGLKRKLFGDTLFHRGSAQTTASG